MRTETFAVFLGALALVSGLVAFSVVAGDGPESVSRSWGLARAERSGPVVAGIDESIVRVLIELGPAAVYTESDLAGVPSEISRVLSGHGVGLVAPDLPGVRP